MASITGTLSSTFGVQASLGKRTAGFRPAPTGIESSSLSSTRDFVVPKVEGLRSLSTSSTSALAMRPRWRQTGGSLKLQRKEGRNFVLRGPRCETTEGGGQNAKVDVWIGRFAMLGFVTAIGTEISSGKGVLANLGISTPAPTLALALTAVVGAVLSFGVFRSAAEE